MKYPILVVSFLLSISTIPVPPEPKLDLHLEIAQNEANIREFTPFKDAYQRHNQMAEMLQMKDRIKTEETSMKENRVALANKGRLGVWPGRLLVGAIGLGTLIAGAAIGGKISNSMSPAPPPPVNNTTSTGSQASDSGSSAASTTTSSSATSSQNQGQTGNHAVHHRKHHPVHSGTTVNSTQTTNADPNAGNYYNTAPQTTPSPISFF